ncbi:MAG: serine/threonine protein kinase [Myxococcales bacterium]|nr:MAG: serine/threonine protein kinase [Myxococcales bacterium]
MSTRANVTAKLPIIVRAFSPGSGQRPSVRPPASRASGVPFAPRVVGRYLLCDVFAAGGMATLHLGRLMGPQGFSRTVAIKQLHPQYAHDPKFVAMFLDEARLASRVHHPNVVSPLDVISHPPDLFMVMDYVHGESLSRLLKRRPGEPVPPRIAAAIIGQVLLGLHAAHDAAGESGEPLELVHRDVSPHNIMVTKDGVAKVVDFGIAKAKARSQQTERGMLKGKLGYMSPEQINFETVDRRADVFAVGVVLWEMLTGRRLFDGDTPDVVLQNLMELPIPAPSSIVPVPPDLDHVVLSALGRSTEERFSNARAMAQALDYATPGASMLELAAWVDERAGDELAARAELVLDVEALRFDDFTQSGNLPFGSTPPPPSQAPAPEPPIPSTPPPVALAAPPKSRLSKKLVVLSALALLLGLSVWAWASYRPSPAVGGAGPSVVALPPTEARPEPAVQAPPAPSIETEAKLPEPSPLAEVAPSPPAAAVVSRPAARQAEPKADAAPPPSASARAVVKPAGDPCAVPYTVDKRGVKRFKEACF